MSKVVSPVNLPTKLPLTATAVAYLLLDKFNAPSWAWGVAGTLYVIIWVLSIVMLYSEERVKLFQKDKWK